VGHGFAAYLQVAVGTVCAGLVWLVFLAGLARLGTLAFLGDLRASFLACRYARIHRACPAGYRLADTIVLRAAASRRIWIVVNIAFDEKNARCVTVAAQSRSLDPLHFQEINVFMEISYAEAFLNDA
jgi:hypothetical protein